MADPFTIRIFVPDGDPEGVRIIDRMNWTGLGLVFPRAKWPEIKQRPEMQRTGVYVLVVDKDHKVQIKRVTTGEALGTDIAIASGLEAGDQVIVNGVQKVRPGQTVSETMVSADAGAAK